MHGLGPANREDARRIDLCKEFGCIACFIQHHVHAPGGDYNHIPLGHNSSHRFGFLLCPWHHVGIVDEGQTAKSMTEMHGPSMRHEKRAFVARFGDTQHLLNKMDDAIGWPRAELPYTKIVPRAAA